MESVFQNKLVQGLHFAEDLACPDCGEQMKEVQRQEETHSVFVWYECTVNDCDGQWLHRIPVGDKANF